MSSERVIKDRFLAKPGHSMTRPTHNLEQNWVCLWLFWSKTQRTEKIGNILSIYKPQRPVTSKSSGVIVVSRCIQFIVPARPDDSSGRHVEWGEHRGRGGRDRRHGGAGPRAWLRALKKRIVRTPTPATRLVPLRSRTRLHLCFALILGCHHQNSLVNSLFIQK